MICNKFSVLLTGLVACVGASVAQGGVYLWTDWQGSTGGTPFVASGTVGGIGVTYTNPQGAQFLQNGSGVGNPLGIDFFANGINGVLGRNDAISPYTSPELANGVDNTPTRLEMVALSKAGSQTLTFNQSVLNPALALVSLNNNTYTFNQEFEILSVSGQNGNAAGYWGNGTATKVANLNGTFSLVTQGEFHGTIQFGGLISGLQWNTQTSENWNGFTVGISAVPEPMTLVVWSGLAAIGGIVAYRRRIAA